MNSFPTQVNVNLPNQTFTYSAHCTDCRYCLKKKTFEAYIQTRL